MLLRAHLPEKYGPARRQSAPRASHSDHDDDPKQETSQDDRESLDDIRQDLQQLNQFAGLTDPTSNPSPAGGEIQRGGSSPADLPPVGAGLKPAPDPSPNGEDTSHSNLSPTSSHPTAPSTSSPSPVVGESLPRTRYGGWGEGDLPHPQHPAPNTQNPPLNRRQRRQLQRKQRKQRKHVPYPDARTKQPNSHRPRAPN